MFGKRSALVLGSSLLLTGCGDAVTCESLKADIEELTQEIAGDFAAAQARADEYDALLEQLLEMECAE
jgi:predicted secreted Zn-dependent protease